MKRKHIHLQKGLETKRIRIKQYEDPIKEDRSKNYIPIPYKLKC